MCGTNALYLCVESSPVSTIAASPVSLLSCSIPPLTAPAAADFIHLLLEFLQHLVTAGYKKRAHSSGGPDGLRAATTTSTARVIREIARIGQESGSYD
jgi:hypothetical protein